MQNGFVEETSWHMKYKVSLFGRENLKQQTTDLAKKGYHVDHGACAKRDGGNIRPCWKRSQASIQYDNLELVYHQGKVVKNYS